MNRDQTRGAAPVEGTQEPRSLDVHELIRALAPQAPGSGAALPSSSSIAPVGLDLMAARPRADGPWPNPTVQTSSVRVPLRRRRLGGIVVVAVGVCALILVAAGIARVGHASSEPETAQAHPAAPDPSPDPAPPSAAPAAAPTAAAVAPSASAPASTGTVRLQRPAVASRVWLDGKKMTSASVVVSCGTHQVRVGVRRTHSIDVPCGGEIAVSK
jgi:hypothetical protein